MAYSLVAAYADTVFSGATAPGLNTVGADLIVLGYADFVSGTPHDSKGNTWTSLTQRSSANRHVRLFYCQSPTTDSSHTFDCSSAGQYNTIFILAFTGSVASPFNAESSGNNAASGTTLQPNSVSPSGTDMFVTLFTDGSNGAGLATIDSSFIIASGMALAYDGSGVGSAMAYKESSSSENPTWSSHNSSAEMCCTMASFKGTGGGGGGTTVKNLAAMGVG